MIYKRLTKEGYKMQEDKTFTDLRKYACRGRISSCNFAVNYNRLAEYEDTGLSPKEIEALQAENAKLTEQLKNAVEKRCKAGDTIYFVNKSCDEDCNEKYVIDEGYVLAISQDKEDLEKGIWWFRGIYNSGLTYWHTDREIGTKVYFDLSAAEARLAELKGGRR